MEKLSACGRMDALPEPQTQFLNEFDRETNNCDVNDPQFSTDPIEAARCAIRSALFDEALASGLKQRIAEMRERLDRLEGTAGKKRSWAATIMQRFELPKIKEPDFTASLRPAPPRVIILAEQNIPDEYLKPQPPKLDKQSILDALKRGDHVQGATLSSQESILSVRTK